MCAPAIHYTASQTLKSLWTLPLSFTIHTDFCTCFLSQQPPKRSFLKTSCHSKKYSTISQSLPQTNSLSSVPQTSNITQIPHSCQILLCFPRKFLNIPQYLWVHYSAPRHLMAQLGNARFKEHWSSLCTYFVNEEMTLKITELVGNKHF